MKWREKQQSKAARRRAGDPSDDTRIAQMIRVDQAGEFGAQRIYQGQLDVLKDHDSAALIQEMADQEDVHLETFNEIMTRRHIRPTALTPLWRIGAYALGAGTALMGDKAAMACTVAVEEVIEDHYAEQINRLEQMESPDQELIDIIKKFRDDEIEHRDTGLAQGAEETTGYPVLKRGIKTVTKIAIRLSEKI